MKILDLQQSTPEWLAARAAHFCASDAPAMMGVSKFMSRDELLRQKATGDVPTVDGFKQDLFDRGHAAEKSARPIIEALLGEELFPATATDDDGRLLASFDGITMAEDAGFEHKLWNAELAAKVEACDLDPHYYWQLEQQILIGGLNRVIFVCSDGTQEKMKWMEYTPVPGRAQQLLAGWKQFEADLKTYQHVEVLPAATGKEIIQLPALTVSVTGMVQSSNLAVYRGAVVAFIQSINTKLETDQHFADAEKTIKFCESAENELDAVKRQALAQTASIDELFRTVDQLKEEMRGKRLELDKLVKARKETIREEIRQSGVNAFNAHINGLNERLGKPYMPHVPVDFAGVMKGKKTLSSLRDAVNTELARGKIEANAVADRIDMNLKTLRDLAKDHSFLFSDTATIVIKANDDLTALVKSRIAEHQQAEQKRLDAERERIRKEEADKAQAAATAPVATLPPVPATAPAPVARTSTGKIATPTTDDIVNLVATHYQVEVTKAVEWLSCMTFKVKPKSKKAA